MLDDKIIVCDTGDNGMLDRYTIVIEKDVFSMSDNPLNPQGFNQYIGTIGCEFTINDIKNWGKQVWPLRKLPSEILEAIILRLQDLII